MYENELFTGKRYRMGYVFDACPDSDWLIVTFSAVAPKNSPVKHHYSFGHSLSNYHVNKLYLQDTPGEEGCYYLCTGLDFGVADTVCDLILNICKKNRIPLSHVITVGSSKGGSAALYFGFRLSLGHVIALVPQTRIGTYARQTHKSIFACMAGDRDPDTAQKILDEVIPNAVRQNDKSTVLHLLTSRGDQQYHTHIEPLLRSIDTDDTAHCDVLIDNRIASHADTINYSRSYVQNTIDKILVGNTGWCGISEPDKVVDIRLDRIILGYELTCRGLTVGMTLTVNSNIYDYSLPALFAFYLLNEAGEIIEKRGYSTLQCTHFQVPFPGKYYIRYFVSYNSAKKAWKSRTFDVSGDDSKEVYV